MIPQGQRTLFSFDDAGVASTIPPEDWERRILDARTRASNSRRRAGQTIVVDVTAAFSPRPGVIIESTTDTRTPGQVRSRVDITVWNPLTQFFSTIRSGGTIEVTGLQAPPGPF